MCHAYGPEYEPDDGDGDASEDAIWKVPETAYDPPEHPQEALRLADFLDEWVDAPDVRALRAAERLEIEDLKLRLARSGDAEAAGDFGRRVEAVRRSFDDVLGAAKCASEQVRDIWPHCRDHARGLIAWLRDLELPPEPGVADRRRQLPKVIADLQVSLAPPRIDCAGETFDPHRCDRAMEVLKILSGSPDEPKALSRLVETMSCTEHAVEVQVHRLKDQMLERGGRMSELASHFYVKDGKLGLWPDPKARRQSVSDRSRPAQVRNPVPPDRPGRCE